MLEKQQKLFVQGHNLEVHDVIKYTRKHRATVSLTTLLIISHARHVLHDVISRSRNRFIVTFGEIRTLLKEYRRTRKGMKDKGIAIAQWLNRLRNNIFVNPVPLPLLCEVSGAVDLAQPGLNGRLAGRQNTGEF